MTTIAHISDLHFDRVDPAAVRALPAELHSFRPDVVIISGDLTQRARRGQYRRAVEFISRLPSPRIIVPGNHDVPLFDSLRRMIDPYGRFARKVSADFFPEFRNDDVHIVGINTACRLAPRWNGFWKDGKIRPIHLDELRRRLPPGLVRPGQLRMLVAHHPFIEPPGGHVHGIIHGAARALPVLESLGIDLILGGHFHLSFRADLRARYPILSRPMLNLVAGSATSTRRRERFNSYNLIRVAAGRAEIVVREFRRVSAGAADGEFVTREQIVWASGD